MSRESSSAIAEWIGRHLLNYGRYKPSSEIAGIIDAITKEDIIRIAGSLPKRKLTLTTLGPQSKLTDYEKIEAQFLAA
jgi:predicted Zn-dependent peptidase